VVYYSRLHAVHIVVMFVVNIKSNQQSYTSFFSSRFHFKNPTRFTSEIFPFLLNPIGSVYGIFPNIYHFSPLKTTKCRWIYQSHGSYGIESTIISAHRRISVVTLPPRARCIARCQSHPYSEPRCRVHVHPPGCFGFFGGDEINPTHVIWGLFHTWIFQVCTICAFSLNKTPKNGHFTYMEDPGIVNFLGSPPKKTIRVSMSNVVFTAHLVGGRPPQLALGVITLPKTNS